MPHLHLHVASQKCPEMFRNTAVVGHSCRMMAAAWCLALPLQVSKTLVELKQLLDSADPGVFRPLEVRLVVCTAAAVGCGPSWGPSRTHGAWISYFPAWRTGGVNVYEAA